MFTMILATNGDNVPKQH